jgi:4-amino-4-deoxy-L-arabinose transferase-like glycosyltransferase
MKKMFYNIIIILILFVAFLIILSIAIVPLLEEQNRIVAYSVMWGIGIVVILLISCILPGFLKIRYFCISDEGIEINVPYHPPFKIKWHDFNKIELREEEVIFRRVKRNLQCIKFISISGNKEIKLEPGRDFRIASIKKILENLKDYANRFNVPIIEYF